MKLFSDPYDEAKQKLESYLPKDPSSPDELFQMIQPLGCTEIVVTKSYCYVKLPVTFDGMVPPEIFAYLEKFTFQVKCGSGTSRSAIYYANACKNSLRRIP